MSYKRVSFRALLRPGVLGGLMLWLVLAAGVNIVAAHSELAESNPANGAVLDEPPEQVWLRFTEELDSAGSSVGVFDQNGQQVDDGNGGVDLNDLDHETMVVTLPESVTNGKYIVRWKAVSADDGDATNGVFAFTIGGAAAVGEQQPIGDMNSNPSPLLLLAGLIAAVLVITGAIYVVRKNRVHEEEIVVG